MNREARTAGEDRSRAGQGILLFLHMTAMPCVPEPNQIPNPLRRHLPPPRSPQTDQVLAQPQTRSASNSSIAPNRSPSLARPSRPVEPAGATLGVRSACMIRTRCADVDRSPSAVPRSQGVASVICASFQHSHVGLFAQGCAFAGRGRGMAEITIAAKDLVRWLSSVSFGARLACGDAEEGLGCAALD